MSSKAEEINRQILSLLKSAEATLQIDSSDVERFLSEATSYLDQFEQLKNALESNQLLLLFSENEQQQLLANLTTIQLLHEEITLRAEESKDFVSDVISDVHKRSSALKTYVDHFPERISITRKKEG